MALFRCSALGVSPSTRSWSFRIHFNSSSSLATVEADWLAQLDTAWISGTNALQAIFATGTILQTTRTAAVQVVTVSTPAGPVQKLRETAVVEDHPALPGTSTNDALPDQNTILVRLHSTQSGKEGRGRIHLPAPDETLVLTSEATAATATKVSTQINQLLVNMGTAGHQAVIVTAVQPSTGTPVGSTRNIVNADTDRIIRTMRTRNKRQKGVYV